MFKGKTEVQDIQFAEIKKTYSVKDKNICIRMQNGMTGIVNGERVILDEVLVNNMMESMVQSVRHNYSKYCPLPDEIILRNASNHMQENKENVPEEKEENSTKDAIIESYEPRFGLEQVVLNSKVYEQIRTAISAVKYRRIMADEWGMSEHFAGNRAIILNFYGKPGTGKSMAAEAIAKELGKKVYHINYADLESKYVGETPKNIRKAFETATRDEAVLIFDEADSFLGKRLTSVTQSADYGVNITRSVLLMELEKFTGVVVFTTNLISNYDEAFKRRILLSVYFEMPDLMSRTAIWKLHLSDKMPLHNEVTVEKLAQRYEGISGADIKDMVFYAALYTLEHGKQAVEISDFDYAYEVIQERYVTDSKEPEVRVISRETITEEQYLAEMRKQEG